MTINEVMDMFIDYAHEQKDIENSIYSHSDGYEYSFAIELAKSFSEKMEKEEKENEEIN